VNPERLLVVDDEPNMLRTVERVLAPHYPVSTVRTPKEALEQAQEFQPDLAILDIRMPDMDGFELMRRLREARADLDVIFMTGVVHELDAQIIRSIRERAFYFIQKPFDREVLLTLVERCVELRRLTTENRRHVMRLERQLEKARSFQHSLLPPEDARIGGVSIHARYQPCDELGGDFYDFAETSDGRVSVLMADVSGHGVSAAMLTSIVKSAFHDAHLDDFEPLAVVRGVARGISAFDVERFVSLICARIASETGRLEIVNAGHPPTLLWGRERPLHPIATNGTIVSPALPEVQWEQVVLDLTPGDRLLLYTDGVTEARSDEGLFGEERLVQAIRESEGPGGELLDRILARVDQFAGGRPMADDRTLLTLQME
jgi:serine phosphatase RsbU (regulator of sigma subunit)